jgi:hypothetical protein
MADFTVDVSTYDATGKVDIDWPAHPKNVNFTGWRVYRRYPGGAWVLIFSTSGDTTRTYDDYYAASGGPVDYSVVQVYTVSGTPTESTRTAVQVEPLTYSYWVVHPTDPSIFNLKLRNVTKDTYNEDYEEETINLIGRGRKLDQGEYWGMSGSIDAQLRDNPTGLTARQQMLAVKDAKQEFGFVYLRNPFGDFFKVNISGISFTRIAGVGPRDFADLSFSYIELEASV